MIYRERLDATKVNAISNMPENARFMSRFGKDFDWAYALPSIYMATNGEDAFMAFEECEPRVWQCTTIFGPTCRGKRAIEVGLEIKEHMRPWADIVFGVVPKDFKHASFFYRKMGGREVDVVETDGYLYTAGEDEMLLRMDY